MANCALLVPVTLAVIFIESAEAWNKCPSGFKDCNPHKPGCETFVEKDINNCGDCGKKCKTLPYAVTLCTGGLCKYSCKAGWGNLTTTSGRTAVRPIPARTPRTVANVTTAVSG